MVAVTRAQGVDWETLCPLVSEALEEELRKQAQGGVGAQSESLLPGENHHTPSEAPGSS